MALFLVQHGKSSPKDVDPEKGLSGPGREQTHGMGDVAAGYRIPVTRIVHSGKTRAAQTAGILKEALGIEAPVEKVVGIGPLDDVRAFAATLDPSAGFMVVGHLPFLGRLVSYLVAGDEEMDVYRFQNSGIVCMDASVRENGELNWFIRWTLNPDIS